MCCERNARPPVARQNAPWSSAPHAERRHRIGDARSIETARRTGRVAAPTAARPAAGPRRRSRRSGRRSRDRARRTRRRCRRDGRAPHRSRCRSARRSRCRSSSRAGRSRPRGAAGGAAASRGASHPAAMARRDDGRQPAAIGDQHDRCAPGRERRQPPRWSGRTTRAPPRDRRTITANGLSGRRFRSRSSRTTARIGRVARQVEPAEPLDRHDRPAAEHRADGVHDDRQSTRPPVAVAELERRTAGRTRHGLGVEAPVAGILVLLPAGLAHREDAHRRALAVVRQRPR